MRSDWERDCDSTHGKNLNGQTWDTVPGFKWNVQQFSLIN